ncbi:hypothetical protein FC89_GL002375 [Liquorilactobacillus ghanensis DSM 18630]|uniref:PTS EIIB type-2 domain-containing protein n=1 Tax=Liquorilactobacillus ghanensis DSM 18630 TaxID=1423750 RepID=A0A0R1VFD6_9LACO|nr:PTS sugar transporter subunit IIB [Liquorilactobacillus ghanensis]KRM03973.1 hypothetical protein FC89_GL002375 [Liquorilactobacillus ghanensis DSM 18630]
MKILAVCGFGVGSSMLLKMTAEKAVKELDINAEVENTDLSTAQATPADLYLTSAELKTELVHSVNAPVYSVKKFMDKEEVKQCLMDFRTKSNQND